MVCEQRTVSYNIGMHETHDFVMNYRSGYEIVGKCRIRIYEEPGRVPVVICSQLPDHEGKSVTNMAEYLAAEVVEEYLPDLPDASPPFVWVQHYPPDTVPAYVGEMFSLVTFDNYERQTVPGGPRLRTRIALGKPSWKDTSRRKVQRLIGTRLD